MVGTCSGTRSTGSRRRAGLSALCARDNLQEVVMKRTVIGTVAALVSMALLTGAMLPLRSSLSIATTALVLVVPVVIGVVIGGFVAGVISVAAGFLVYDFFFIPPYLTLWVGRQAQNWVALAVYVA